MNHSRPVRSPRADCDSEVEPVGQAGGSLGGHRVHVRSAKTGKAEPQGEGAQAVAAADAVLLDELHLAEAHEIGMGLARRHACRVREAAQHHWLDRVREDPQEAPSNFDRLDAARRGADLGVQFSCPCSVRVFAGVARIKEVSPENISVSQRLTMTAFPGKPGHQS